MNRPRTKAVSYTDKHWQVYNLAQGQLYITQTLKRLSSETWGGGSKIVTVDRYFHEDKPLGFFFSRSITPKKVIFENGYSGVHLKKAGILFQIGTREKNPVAVFQLIKEHL
jgi:hypothetical protein